MADFMGQTDKKELEHMLMVILHYDKKDKKGKEFVLECLNKAIHPELRDEE